MGALRRRGDAWEPEGGDGSWPFGLVGELSPSLNAKLTPLGVWGGVPSGVKVAIGTSGRPWLVWQVGDVQHGTSGIDRYL